MDERERQLNEQVEYVLQWVSQGAYRTVPLEVSRKLRALYEAQLPQILCTPGTHSFFTPRGALLATGYERVVIGDYGAYVEFLPEQVETGNVKPKWNTRAARAVKYLWWTPKDGSPVKLYEQQDLVKYADYRVGRWYVAPAEVIIV